jgi:Phage anti-repressor protein
MNYEMSIFTFDDGDVRVVIDEQGNPWFVAKDVSERLGYKNWDGGVIRRKKMPEGWVEMKQFDTPGGWQYMLTLSEQGLYFFLEKSGQARVSSFQAFIYNKVIPQIRETGSCSGLNNKIIAAKTQAGEEIAMNDLIKIGQAELEGQIIQTVNARDLHEFLESKQEFATWIKNRIRDYNFNENVDFVCLTNLSSEGRGGQNRIDYHISLDMAKEISMVERNARGKQARQYFIECEKKLRSNLPNFNNPVMAARAWADKVEQLQITNAQLAIAAPKAAFCDDVLTSDGTLTITQISKDYGITAPKFNQLLHNLNVQFEVNGQWVLYAEHQNKGYTHSVTIFVNGGKKPVVHTQWTQTGREFIYRLLKGVGMKPVVEIPELNYGAQ